MHESRKYSTLAFCAFKNHTHCFKSILAHGRKNLTELELAEWADKLTDEKFTALHFATYHANFDLIKIIVEDMGGNINLNNVYGANVLHIAAQGDAPTPLYYFIKLMGMDLHSVDNRGSTPLHWACYSKSEFALGYILAMKPDLDLKDQAGFTPLHLAIRTVGDLNTTRPVRALLLKGASRNSVNSKGETC